MIIHFANKALENMYCTWYATGYSNEIVKWFIKKIAILKNAKDERDIRAFTWLHFEKLSNYRRGAYSIKVNDQRRIIFDIINKDEVKIIEIQELSDHYN